MAYTAEQQNRIDTANAKVASAQTAYDNAITIRDGNYEHLRSTYNDANTSCYESGQGSLEGEIAWGGMSSGNCKTRSSCNHCAVNVAKFNGALSGWNSSSANVLSKLSLLSTAKEELKNLLDTIASEVQNDPDFINTQTQIGAQAEADAKAKRLKIWFWIISVIVAGGVVFAVLKWGTKKILPTG